MIQTLFLVILISFNVRAAVPNPACLGDMGAWIKQPSPNENEQIFRKPTNKFGVWLETHLFKDKGPISYTITNKKVQKNQYDQKCRIQNSYDEGFDFSKTYPDSSVTFLTDEKLEELIRSEKNKLVYVWSPEMVYSAENLPKYKKTAEELKIEFVPVLDPRSNETDHVSQATFYKFEKTKYKLNSVELFMRNATLHFPTVFLIKNNKLADFRISGVYDQFRFKKELTKELAN